MSFEKVSTTETIVPTEKIDRKSRDKMSQLLYDKNIRKSYGIDGVLSIQEAALVLDTVPQLEKLQEDNVEKIKKYKRIDLLGEDFVKKRMSSILQDVRSGAAVISEQAKKISNGYKEELLKLSHSKIVRTALHSIDQVLDSSDADDTIIFTLKNDLKKALRKKVNMADVSYVLDEADVTSEIKKSIKNIIDDYSVIHSEEEVLSSTTNDAPVPTEMVPTENEADEYTWAETPSTFKNVQVNAGVQVPETRVSVPEVDESTKATSSEVVNEETAEEPEEIRGNHLLKGGAAQALNTMFEKPAQPQIKEFGSLTRGVPAPTDTILVQDAATPIESVISSTNLDDGAQGNINEKKSLLTKDPTIDREFIDGAKAELSGLVEEMHADIINNPVNLAQILSEEAFELKKKYDAAKLKLKILAATGMARQEEMNQLIQLEEKYINDVEGITNRMIEGYSLNSIDKSVAFEEKEEVVKSAETLLSEEGVDIAPVQDLREPISEKTKNIPRVHQPNDLAEGIQSTSEFGGVELTSTLLPNNKEWQKNQAGLRKKYVGSEQSEPENTLDMIDKEPSLLARILAPDNDTSTPMPTPETVEDGSMTKTFDLINQLYPGVNVNQGEPVEKTQAAAE